VVFRSGRGSITLPLKQIGRGPMWAGMLGRFEHSQLLSWWIVAQNTEGKRSTSPILRAWVGTLPVETVSVIAGRHFSGTWGPAQTAWGAAKTAAAAGARDTAEAHFSGGTYEAWILAGGSRDTAVWIDGNFLAHTDTGRPDGWQHVGKIKLAAGVHTIEVVSGQGKEGAAACYGQILLTTSSSFRPPPQAIFDVADSLSLLTPVQGEAIGPRTEVLATAAGNVSRVDFYVDGQLSRRLVTPPYSFNWDSGRLQEGPHLLRLEGMNRAGQTLVSLEIEVYFSRKPIAEQGGEK
jgi:hypothetical protein